MIWLDTFLGADEHIEPITNVYRNEDEITQETPMKFEDRPEPYTPISHPVDGNDNQITENSNRKIIDQKIMKGGIYRLQILGMIIKLYNNRNDFFVLIF